MEQKHIPDLSTECIDWDGATDDDGYGRLQINGKWRLAHRVAFEAKHGAIEHGMVIDHLCRNRRCVNVMHMEIVTNYENIMRGEGVTSKNAMKLYCDHGHKLIGGNLGLSKKGRRFCRECGRRRWREYRERKIKNGTWTRT